MAQRLCVLQHADNEGIGSMQRWFAERKFDINVVRVDQGAPLPPHDSFDWLAVMGGPMSAYEEAQYPWLSHEKKWLRQAVFSDKRVLGICLGSQLIASALDADVYPNDTFEIGWYPITRIDPSITWLPPKARLLSWHGDRFDLPSGAKPFASSEVTPNQGFSYGNRVWALQFHVEAEPDTIDAFIEANGGELPRGEWVQSLEQLKNSEHFASSEKIARDLLDFMAAR